MNHRTASNLLVDLASGTLPRERERAVSNHVDQCGTCRRWLSDFRLLASGLGARESVEENHPASDLLSLWALHPEELEEGPRRTLAEHLARCPACRREARLVRAAVTAREEADPVSRRSVVALRLLSTRRTLVAAGVCALIFGLGALGQALWLGGQKTGSAISASTAEVEPPASRPPVHRAARLSGVELEGHRLLETDGTMIVTDVKITPGARVTLRAGKSIALANGFEVAAGARAIVSTTPPSIRGDTEP